LSAIEAGGTKIGDEKNTSVPEFKQSVNWLQFAFGSGALACVCACFDTGYA
jgi:hypothetical protein